MELDKLFVKKTKNFIPKENYTKPGNILIIGLKYITNEMQIKIGKETGKVVEHDDAVIFIRQDF